MSDEKDRETSGDQLETTEPAGVATPRSEDAILLRFAQIVGVGRERWSQLNYSERVRLARFGAMVICGATFVFTGVFAGLTEAAGDRIPHLARLSIAGLIAIIVANFDASFIARALAHAAEKAGHEAGLAETPPREGVARMFFWRSIQASVTGLVVAIMLLVIVFADDIEERLIDDAKAKNAPLTGEYTLLWERQESELLKELEETRGYLKDTRGRLQSENSFPGARDADIAAGRRRLEELTAAFDKATERAREYRRLEEAERQGAKIDGATGEPGCYRQCKFFEAEAIANEKAASRLLTELLSQRNRVDELIELNEAARHDQEQMVQSRREGYETALKNDQLRIERLREDLTVHRDGRNEWITAHVEMDPDYSPVATTLSAKLSALESVFTRSALVLVFAIALKLLILMLDLSAVVQHALGGAPKINALIEISETEETSNVIKAKFHKSRRRAIAEALERQRREDELREVREASRWWAAARARARRKYGSDKQGENDE